jgi:hypothetical protein
MRSDATMERLVQLAQQQIEAEAEVARCEEELERAKARLRQIQIETIPPIMDDIGGIGVAELRLSNGAVLKIEEQLRTSISKQNTSAAMAWLRQNGHGHLIKTQVIVTSKDEDRIAQVRQLLAPVPFVAGELDNKEGVHHSTLRAWVRRMLTNGQQLPDSIAVFRQRVSKVEVAS